MYFVLAPCQMFYDNNLKHRPSPSKEASKIPTNLDYWSRASQSGQYKKENRLVRVEISRFTKLIGQGS